jgi:hypothetical protein
MAPCRCATSIAVSPSEPHPISTAGLTGPAEHQGNDLPHFEDFYAAKLRGSLGVTDAESVLDLRGANRATAEASLKDMLERSRFAKGKTVAIRLDPPPEGGGETLFQPAGRLLLDAKRRGLIERLQTLPAQDGLGFYVSLSGRTERTPL